MKSGVAIRLVLNGDCASKIPKFSQEYAVSATMGIPIQPNSCAVSWLMTALQISSLSIDSDMLSHLTQSLLSTSTLAGNGGGDRMSGAERNIPRTVPDSSSRSTSKPHITSDVSYRPIADSVIEMAPSLAPVSFSLSGSTLSSSPPKHSHMVSLPPSDALEFFPMTEIFIEHLAACLIRFAKRASESHANRMKKIVAEETIYKSMNTIQSSNRLSSSSSHHHSPPPGKKVNASIKEMNDTEGDGSYDVDDVKLFNNRSDTFDGDDNDDDDIYFNQEGLVPSEETLGTTAGTNKKGNSADALASHTPIDDGIIFGFTDYQENHSNHEGASHHNHAVKSPSSISAMKKAKWSHMDQWCKQSIHDEHLSMDEKLWLAVSRTDGGSGQLLGQAVSKGLDGIRTWICCYVLYCTPAVESTGKWNGHSSTSGATPFVYEDNKLPQSKTTFKQALSELYILLRQIFDSQISYGSTSTLEVDIEHSILFVVRSWECLHRRHVQMQIPLACQHLYHLPGVLPMQALTSTANNSLDTTKINERRNENVLLRQYVSGELLTVHCGHNGSYGLEEMRMFMSLVTPHISQMNQTNQ